MALQRGDSDGLELAQKAGYKLKDPGALALKAMSEIRGQLQSQNQTRLMLAEMSAVIWSFPLFIL